MGLKAFMLSRFLFLERERERESVCDMSDELT